jgi:sulfur carrier protein
MLLILDSRPCVLSAGTSFAGMTGGIVPIYDMQIILNGQKKEIPAGLTVEELLRHLAIKPERVAVEINEEIVRKAAYAATAVKEGDRVEVVQFMGGGAEGAGSKFKV